MSDHDRRMGRYLIFKKIGHNEPGNTYQNCIPAPHDQTLCEQLGIDVNFDIAENYHNATVAYMDGQLKYDDFVQIRKRKSGDVYGAKLTYGMTARRSFFAPRKIGG